MDQRANFLALILLDAVEDQNESDVYSILEKNNVDASHVLKERGISALHYTCGMENQKLSLDFCKVFLERGANPNVLSDENMTPLHVAAMYGRVEIVKLLLQHGAKLDVFDDQRKMPLHYAIEECHFDVVQLMRDQIFLKKYENKKTSTPNRANINIGCINKHLQVASESAVNGNGLLTPNKIHYNYDVTSPYYINITHRRHKPQPVFPAVGTPQIEINEVETPDQNSEDKSNSEDIQSVNLFALTKESLQEMSRHLTPSERTRISIIETWREKVRQSRANQAILKEYSDVEEMIDNVMENDHLNFTNTLLKEKSLKEGGENGDSEADSGACGSEQNENIQPPIPARSGFSLGQLIQKIAKAQLINNEPQQKQKRPTPSKSDPNETISSFKTVPEYPATNGKVVNEQSKDTLKVPDRDTSFIRSPKSVDYFLQMTEAYVHTDDENGLVFYETKLLSNQNCKAAQLPTNSTPQINTDHDATVTSHSTNITLPVDYETDALRAELTNFGIPPGPITKSTKRLYIKRLIKYKRKTASMLELQKQQQQEITKFSVELQRTLQSLEDFARVAEYLKFEKSSAQYFAQHKDKREMREGHLKQSFIYMLIDPRTSCNLPGESVFLEKMDIWQRFLNSIFYVGKGKTSRPYSHLYAAMKTHSRQHAKANNQELTKNGEKKSIRKTALNMDIFKSPPLKPTESRKLDRILDIWGNGNGVVCLHVFHNIVPSEAYTREAAIIDAIGLKHLTNMKRGDYYGPAKTWPMKEKKYLGIALLYKAMQIYLAEGESQLSPSDLI